MRAGKLQRFFILLLAIAGLIPVYAQGKETIRIGWVYALANAPVLIAEEQNLFAKHGVDVELRVFNSGPLVMRAFEAGDLDMAYIGMPPLYHAHDKGLGLKIVAKVNYGQAALITRHDSDIKSLADLKHKRIASVREGSGMDVLLRGFVLKESAGLNPEHDVTIVRMPAKIMQSSVQRGLVDAALTWEPYVSQAVIADNARILLDINEVLPRYPWYVLVASEVMTNQKRAVMMKVLRAHEDAVHYLNKSPDAGAQLLVEKFNLANTIRATGSNASPLEVVRQARLRLGWECQFKAADKNFLQRLINYSKEVGQVSQPVNAEDLIDQAAVDSFKAH